MKVTMFKYQASVADCRCALYQKFEIGYNNFNCNMIIVNSINFTAYSLVRTIYLQDNTYRLCETF